jgi:hypothetical protein
MATSIHNLVTWRPQARGAANTHTGQLARKRTRRRIKRSEANELRQIIETELHQMSQPEPMEPWELESLQALHELSDPDCYSSDEYDQMMEDYGRAAYPDPNPSRFAYEQLMREIHQPYAA